MAGEIITTGVADGYAYYMVFGEKPLTLIHMPIGDAWRAGAIWERGLRIADARQMPKVERENNKFIL